MPPSKDQLAPDDVNENAIAVDDDLLPFLDSSSRGVGLSASAAGGNSHSGAWLLAPRRQTRTKSKIFETTTLCTRGKQGVFWS